MLKMKLCQVHLRFLCSLSTNSICQLLFLLAFATTSKPHPTEAAQAQRLPFHVSLLNHPETGTLKEDTHFSAGSYQCQHLAEDRTALKRNVVQCFKRHSVARAGGWGG